jgi:hypothetical protein
MFVKGWETFFLSFYLLVGAKIYCEFLCSPGLRMAA